MADPNMQGAESITQSEHISPTKTGDNIEAKRVANYVWNGSTWERQSTVNQTTQPIYKKLIDDTTTPNVTYIGEATLGTLTSVSSWRIKRIDESSGVVITWSGTGFDSEWDERALTVVYS